METKRRSRTGKEAGIQATGSCKELRSERLKSFVAVSFLSIALTVPAGRKPTVSEVL